MEVTFNKENSKRYLYGFVIVSFLIHLSASFVYLKEGTNFNLLTEKEEETRILIKLQDFKKDLKQIAQTENSNNKKSDKPKFLSAKNNAFERETKSANNGTFKAAGIGSKTAVANRNTQQQKKRKKVAVKDLKFSDLAFKPIKDVEAKKKHRVTKRALQKKGLKNGKKSGMGLGQTNDFLEDIPLGDFTRLNTQEYEFYGFYNRIRQKLEQFWGVNIQEQADKIYKEGRSLASDSNLITGLTISLNGKGEIVQIRVNSTSGMKELDEAAIQSFNQAGPFPNPPKGMLKDGKATIEWGFVVNT